MSDPELIRACKLWDKITTKMNNKEYEMPDELNHVGENRPYTSGDYSPLKCTIDGKTAELTVGSSVGHRVHVDLEKKELLYYDNDSQPNQVMNDLLEEAGLKCEVEHLGVRCSGVDDENVQEVFKVLAMPTSMDYRLDNCQREKRPDPTDQCEESCDETMESEHPDNPCDCSEWKSDCTQECVDNWEYDDEDEDCNEIEKDFFRSGPQKESLTKKEAVVNPKSQKKISEFERVIPKSEWGT